GAVKSLGVAMVQKGHKLHLSQQKSKTQKLINCGESGTTLRLLLPIFALFEEETIFTGQGRLLERPQKPFQDIFASAQIEFSHNQAEIKIKGPLKSGCYSLPGDISSQFVSGLMLALPLTAKNSEIQLTSPLQSRPYVDLTIDVMNKFGVTVEEKGDSFHILGGQSYHHSTYQVEADYSQAAFFLVAAALGANLTVGGLITHSRQGDKKILNILEQMGAQIIWQNGAIAIKATDLRPLTIDVGEIPDLVPILAVLCCFCAGKSHIVNAKRLRFKESDRLTAITLELKKLKANIQEEEDALTIWGGPQLFGATVEAHNDHRIAMALAVAAIKCQGQVHLNGWSSVAKSYPTFWQDFEGGN
ncbi:MAG: 3-phosphoshikimate 1-carboxyvinyltransferase, partial [Candidatus Adiutrix sp.]